MFPWWRARVSSQLYRNSLTVLLGYSAGGGLCAQTTSNTHAVARPDGITISYDSVRKHVPMVEKEVFKLLVLELSHYTPWLHAGCLCTQTTANSQAPMHQPLMKSLSVTSYYNEGVVQDYHN